MHFKNKLKVLTKIFVIVLPLLFLVSCGDKIEKGSGSAESVLERLNTLQQTSSASNSFLIPSVTEEDLLKGVADAQQIAVNGDYFQNSCFSALTTPKKNSKNNISSWVSDSFLYFKFKLSGDYILPKGFFVYYDDVFNASEYPDYNENPFLNNIYMAFNGITVTDVNVTDIFIYCYIPKGALKGEVLEIIVLFPNGEGGFYDKGKETLSIQGIGFLDENVERVEIKSGLGYAMQASAVGNLSEKTSTVWYKTQEDGSLTSQNMKFYFKLSDPSDLTLNVSYQTLSNDQTCAVYLNDKYIGNLSKTENLVFHKEDIKEGIQKVEFKVEGAIPASDIFSNAQKDDKIGIKINYVTLK